MRLSVSQDWNIQYSQKLTSSYDRKDIFLVELLFVTTKLIGGFKRFLPRVRFRFGEIDLLGKKFI